MASEKLSSKKLILDLMEDYVLDEKDATIVYSEESKTSIPQWMKSVVKRGLRTRDKQVKSNKCCTDTGLARANQILNGENLSLRTLNRMKSFSARHSADLDFKTLDKNSKQAQSLMLWGISPSKSGVDKFNSWVDREIKKKENS